MNLAYQLETGLKYKNLVKIQSTRYNRRHSKFTSLNKRVRGKERRGYIEYFGYYVELFF